MSTLSSAEPAPPIAREKLRVIFGGLFLVLLLAALDATIIATALPTIVAELGGLTRLSWVVSAYLLAQTTVTPLYGKLGDLYGRKRVLQVAIILFLLGSALCGMSRSMTQLVFFRALQGLGGGGLIVTTQAVVGDIVSPRERGRYQGIFGAVFGVASIAGPLIGGYLTTHLSWRWIFYVNLPLGVIALAVLAATLPARGVRVRHSMDYVGAALLATAIGAIVLISDLVGITHAWNSPIIIGLGALTLVALGGFLLAERRAPEPVLPLRLFRNRTFSVAAAIGLIVGFALFGSVTYVPLFLQVVKGASPTASGLQLFPMMSGMFVTSIVSGQIISRTGRYKVFPVAGTALMAIGLLLLSRVTPTTSIRTVLGIMVVLGLGLGMVMQVLLIAVQNTVDYAELGVATSGAIVFRFIGGSLGTAVLGSIFAARLEANVMHLLPPGARGAIRIGELHTQMLAQLPASIHDAYAQAFTASLHTAFAVAAGIACLGFVLSWLLPERPLRETITAATGDDIGGDIGEAFAMPTDDESLPQLLRGVAVLAERDVQRRHIADIVTRAGVNLSADAAWLLLRIEEDASSDPVALALAQHTAPILMLAARAELRDRELVAETMGADGRGPWRELTPMGRRVLGRLVAARRARLMELFSEWAPEKREELAERLRLLARDLVPEPRPFLTSRRARV